MLGSVVQHGGQSITMREPLLDNIDLVQDKMDAHTITLKTASDSIRDREGLRRRCDPGRRTENEIKINLRLGGSLVGVDGTLRSWRNPFLTVPS